MERPRIDTVIQMGVKAIDGLLTIGKGQRMGIFAGSGVGKNTLMGMIAKNVKADVNVIALVGERSREVVGSLTGIWGKKGSDALFWWWPPQPVRHDAFKCTMTLPPSQSISRIRAWMCC